MTEPGIADAVFHSHDPRWIGAARLVAGVWLAAFAALTLVAGGVTLLAGGLSARAALAACAGWFVVVAAFGVLAVAWPALRFRHASYRVSAQGIQIRRGVLWRAEISVPRSRIQHTDVTQGPVARGFGLATLILHTAGTEHAAVGVAGLARETAEAIRDHLIEAGTGDAV